MAEILSPEMNQPFASPVPKMMCQESERVGPDDSFSGGCTCAICSSNDVSLNASPA